jgi:hypothetical protein
VTAPTKKASLGEQWRLVQELLDEAELERLGAMTPEQMEEEAKNSGLGEAKARALIRRAIERGEPPPASNVRDMAAARKRLRGPGVIVARIAIAASVAATIAAGAAAEWGPITAQWAAWFHPAPTPTQQPVPPLVPPTHEETPLEKARRLREEAYVNVQKGYFKDAADELNEAAEIDPAGDADERVAKARYDIKVGDPKRIPSSKMGPDRWESPLPHTPRPIQR